MYYDGGWFMGGMHFLWWVFWILIFGALAWAFWGRRDGTPGERPAPRETPLEVLQRRLASGECTPEEYEQRKALLERDGSAGR